MCFTISSKINLLSAIVNIKQHVKKAVYKDPGLSGDETSLHPGQFKRGF